jgi:hypothetical protein
VTKKGYVTCADCGLVRYVQLYNVASTCWHCAQKRRLKPVLAADYLPIVGERRNGREIGKTWGLGQTFEYKQCCQCGQPRWVSIANMRSDNDSRICHKCNNKRTASQKGPANHTWKGGRYISTQGYIRVLVPGGDFFAPMADTHGTVFEHRLVMAQHLGRCLQRFEVVHHKNGIKQDNSLSNLQLIMNGAHSLNHSRGYKVGYRQGYQDGINSKIQELHNEIRLLRLQLNRGEVPVT